MPAVEGARESAPAAPRTRDVPGAVPPAEPPGSGTWPHALSHEPLLRVSDVLALIQPEFPALTTSKLRFLDAQGLVSPGRTGSGYRQYSPADVERLRFVLRQQRDHFRPLTVIHDHLASLDSGEAREPVAPHAVAQEEPAWMTARQLAAFAGVETDLVAALAGEGLVTEGVPGKFPRDAVPVVHAAAGYLVAGGDLRALRVLHHAALREVERSQDVAAPARARGDYGAASNGAQEFGEAAIAVFAAVVRRAGSAGTPCN